MDGIKWERLAAVAICVCFFTAAFFLLIRFALPILLPFLVAAALAMLIRPAAARLSRALHLPKRLCAAVLLIAALGGILFLLGAAVNRLLGELEHLLERLLADFGDLGMSGTADYFEILTSELPFLRRIGAAERFAVLREGFNNMVREAIEGLVRSLSASVPTLAARVASALPGILLVSIVTVISGFYFCMEKEAPTAVLCRYLPHSIGCRLPDLRKRVKRLSLSYLRAYLLLLLLTFAELFLGFSLLRIDFALLLAMVVALVDLLPLLGVGTVLVPWAAVLLLRHNYYVGFGLLILYFAVTVLRQILEPRLVGKSLGLHPLLTLLASYAGWRLFGFLGMLLGPILAMLIKNAAAFCKPLSPTAGDTEY